MKQTNQQKSDIQDLRTALYCLIDKAVMNQRAVDERKIAPEQRDEMNVKNCNNLIEEFFSQSNKKSEMEWEKEFDEKLSHAFQEAKLIFNWRVFPNYILKDFIRQLLSQSRQQFAEEIEEVKKETRLKIGRLFINNYDNIIQGWARYRGGKTFFEFCDDYLAKLTKE